MLTEDKNRRQEPPPAQHCNHMMIYCHGPVCFRSSFCWHKLARLESINYRQVEISPSINQVQGSPAKALTKFEQMTEHIQEYWEPSEDTGGMLTDRAN